MIRGKRREGRRGTVNIFSEEESGGLQEREEELFFTLVLTGLHRTKEPMKSHTTT